MNSEFGMREQVKKIIFDVRKKVSDEGLASLNDDEKLLFVMSYNISLEDERDNQMILQIATLNRRVKVLEGMLRMVLVIGGFGIIGIGGYYIVELNPNSGFNFETALAYTMTIGGVLLELFMGASLDKSKLKKIVGIFRGVSDDGKLP